MALGVLCPKCAAVVPAGVPVCVSCGTALGEGAEAATSLIKQQRAQSHGLTALDDEAPKASTQPFNAFTPDVTIEINTAHLTTGERLSLIPAEPINESFAKAPTSPRRLNALPGARLTGPVPSVGLPPARRSGTHASHQAALGTAAAPSALRKDPLTGEKLGEYIVEERIGTGGMGVVYKARQPQIGSTVAIKILRGDVIADKRDMERLLDEARVVNAIKHRGIINIFGAGELSDGRQYLVMEYLDGETLEKRLETVGRLTTAAAIPILDEVLAALAAAHSTGIVHRDLKPANVFLVRQSDGPDLVKLLDFGLARRQMQEVTRIAGTPDYISPEHARGRPAGAPADLYGFGVLAFHLLTGRLPFQGNTPMEMMEQHVHAAPPIPAEINPSIPPVMSGLILALLAKDPAKRPDADGAKRDLKAAGRQLQEQQRLDEPLDGATPKEGRQAITAPSLAMEPRPSEFPRQAKMADFGRKVARNWPWVLASTVLVWIFGLVIWMLLTPPAVPPPTSLPVPVPINTEPVSESEQTALSPDLNLQVQTQPEPPQDQTPKLQTPELQTPELQKPEPQILEPQAETPPSLTPRLEGVDPEAPPMNAESNRDPDFLEPLPLRPPDEANSERTARENEEAAVRKWRVKMRNDLTLLDARLSGPLEQFRPELNTLMSDVKDVTNPPGQQSAEGRLKALKAKISTANERR